jgi:RNA polymerase sigma-70 factor (ECF subfamily)
MTTSELEQTWTAVEDNVRGYLHNRLGGDAATVDDLAQEVFLRLRNGLDGLRSAGSLGPWVMRVTRGVLVDHIRRRRPSAPVEDLVAEEGGSEDREVIAALAGFVRERIDDLPAHEAQVISLVDLDGLAPADAAKRLAIGLPALKARLRRGRQRLRLAIERCCAVTLDGRGQPADCTPLGAGCGSCTTIND